MSSFFDGKTILVTGGTGSLGKVLVDRILTGEMGTPEKVIIFSRDEAKQYYMRQEYLNVDKATDEILYNNLDRLKFVIGDVRNMNGLKKVVKDANVIYNAAALKQVPTCEYFPAEAVMTNINGPSNIVDSIISTNADVDTVVGISTDKACKPVNVMGMTKAIQEKIFIGANLDCENTRFVCTRYGNVLASRGSVIPLFQKQIMDGGPITITTEDMTRYLMNLDQAVDLIFTATLDAKRGETYIPKIPAGRMMDVANCLIGDRDIKIKITGIRPGEKIHEVLISREEITRTVEIEENFVIKPILPELQEGEIQAGSFSFEEYTSADCLIGKDEIYELLRTNNLLV